jgi:hypothetical protein
VCHSEGESRLPSGIKYMLWRGFAHGFGQHL